MVSRIAWAGFTALRGGMATGLQDLSGQAQRAGVLLLVLGEPHRGCDNK